VVKSRVTNKKKKAIELHTEEIGKNQRL
jgi:hypothetical protein